jgi:protein O-GlcNAc transferase
MRKRRGQATIVAMSLASGLLSQVQRMLAAGQWRAARPLLEQLASEPQPDPRVVRQLAELEILSGEAARALERLAALGTAHDDEAAFLAARAEKELGRPAAARDQLLALRARLATPSPMLEVHLAAAHEALGDDEAALEALRGAIRLKPDFTAAHKNLAAMLSARGRVDELRAALREAVAQAPRDTGLWLRRAHAESAAGNAQGVSEALAQAAALGPDADGWRQIGLLHGEYWRYDEADAAFARASALDPGLPAIETVWASIKQEMGDSRGALEALARSRRRSPADLRTAMGERLLLPQVYEDGDDARRWRERYAAGLDLLLQEAPRWLPAAGDIFLLNRTNFLLAYQGEDDLELQREHARFVAALAGHARPDWRAAKPIRFDGSRRLRVGFIANIFRECTAGRYFERWITGLDAQRFERVVYHTSPYVDELTRRIAAAADRFVPIREGTAQAAAQMQRDELDLIVYPEVGMSPMTHVLTTLRLAPVQVAGWGHPVTTGSDAIDHYITCGAMEPADAAGHYVETLIRLPGLGVDYPMPPPAPAATRRELGLPEGRRLYACAQSLFKIHPDMDDLFADILERDSEAVIALFQAGARRVTEAMAARLQRTLVRRGIPPRNQVKFLGRASTPQFRTILSLCDVVLDTVRWSGGNTSLDALAAGVPVVTLEGRFMRGRQTAAMLRMLGLDALVAATPEDYVRIAVEVARDPDRNAALRRAIAGRRAELFDRPEPVAALAEALLRAGAGRL